MTPDEQRPDELLAKEISNKMYPPQMVGLHCRENTLNYTAYIVALEVIRRVPLVGAACDIAPAVADAADLLAQYADFIRHSVKAHELERHPYLPEIERVVEELRAAIAKATSPGGEQ